MQPGISDICSGRSLRAAQRAQSIEELRQMARARLPSPVFDYVEGGADDEQALGRNREAYARWNLIPHQARGVAQPDLGTRLLGQPLRIPLVAAPVGMAGLMYPRADEYLAKISGAMGGLFMLATASSSSIEDVGAAGPGPKVFQLHIPADRELGRNLVSRAKAAGFSAICITLDNPTHGNRIRDQRNGLHKPFRIWSKFGLSALRHPGWTLRMMRIPPRLANFDRWMADNGGLDRLLPQLIRPCSWDEIAWVRELWPGPMALKGVLSAADVARAGELGIDAVFLSNQGGRHFDAAPSPLSMLPAAVEAARGKTQIVVDGGIRRGSDMAKAIALGAAACSTARPFCYGLGAAGPAGAARAWEILREELRTTMIFLGCAGLNDLDATRICPSPGI